MSVRRAPGELGVMLADGTLARIANERDCQTWSALAEAIGTSKNAFEKWSQRQRAAGRPMPTLAALRAGYTPALETFVQPELDEKPDFANREDKPSDPPVVDAAFDFSDEPTQPSRKRWPSVQAFDVEEANRTTMIADMIGHDVVRKLSREDAPEGALLLWVSDVHIPIDNTPALKLMVECAEWAGVHRIIAGGDILDLNCLSFHPKESERTVAHSTLLEEVEPGRWFLNWLATKPSHLILGNHEDRLKRFIDMNPALHGSPAGNIGWLVDLPKSIEVLPQGSEIRLGNLDMFHGDAEFKNGTGGKYPAQRLLDMIPDSSSIAGHVHRQTTACRTSRDEDGVHRTRRAWTMGHMSYEHKHRSYASKRPNWQTGFGFIRVRWEDDRPRWSVYQVEVMFDRRNRPYFEFGGRWFS